MDPEKTAPRGAVSSGVHTVCNNDFYNHKQMTKQTTKQTTIVVTGSLRVKIIEVHVLPSKNSFCFSCLK